MIINGREMAAEVLARTKRRVEALGRRPKVAAYVLLATPATRSYLAIKAKSAARAGCDFEIREHLPLVPDADAIIVQLPLPSGMDTKALCDTIPVEKDADVLSTAARTLFGQRKEGALLPPVVAAIKEIFDTYHVTAKGKHAVVIGGGYLVGEPAALWLGQCGAQVEVIDRSTEDLRATLRTADIIVSGAGAPHLITPDMLKDGVVLIDAATSESNGEIVGDADPACAQKCSLFTPVPGGAGPLAVAKLFENAIELAQRANSAILSS